jgi:hypothetical protein
MDAGAGLHLLLLSVCFPKKKEDRVEKERRGGE